MIHECLSYHCWCGSAPTYKETNMGTNRQTTDGLDYPIEATDLNFLKKDDRIRLVRTKGRVEVLYATADMDGHSVSSHYGKVNGTDHFDKPENCYLNVRFDHTAYSGDWRKSNDSIKATDPFRVYVNATVRDRIVAAKAGLVKDTKKAELRKKLADAEAIIADVRRQMSELGD